MSPLIPTPCPCPDDLPRLLRTAEVAERLGLAADTVREHVREGRLPAFRLGARLLFSWPAIEAALADAAVGFPIYLG